MNIDLNTVVSVNYKLTNLTTGEFVEETNTDNPLVFLYGVGSLLPDFEANLHNKKVGDTFEFSINADLAYGPASDEHIVMIPRDVFQDEAGNIDETIIFAGAIVPMMDNEGNRLRGTVLALEAEHVKMDFNHPLAGQDLHFSGEILDVREASSDEIAHGHAHGPGGHQH
jgi:FKBP-type peptidyl-prolyl cis-trans isomerase SlyD